MSEISSALQNARTAVEHPQCGGGFQTQVSASLRPFGDPQALAIPFVHGVSEQQKKEAKALLEVWERKCGHSRGDHLNHSRINPALPPDLQHWQGFLAAALRK